MRTYDKHYVGGEWIAPENPELIDVINASTEDVMGRVPAGSARDVERAVRAARDAFEAWSRTPVGERVSFLERIGAALAESAEEMTRTISGEVGMPLKLCGIVQVGMPTKNFGHFANILREYRFEEQVGSSLVLREPMGVVACITPWNYPLHQIVAKVAPALAAGCTVVLKPSEVAPLNAFLLAEIIHAVGLPKGVFNLVCGVGSVVGEALAASHEVDMVSFTGSTRAGKRVSELAAGTVKRVALELGGKSPNVLLDDADFERAVQQGVNGAFLNSGQTCSALTRMLVPRSRRDEVIALAKKAAESLSVGDPFGGKAKLGPLISDVQRERVRGYIQKGIAEGATLVTGGAEPPEGLTRGYYVRPTVFADVKPSMTIAQEEIFGPVLAIMSYEDEEDAVRLANDTIYGLAAGVWSRDPERAKRVARRIRAGQVDINGGAFNALAPFGGYKQSGNGRELGKLGFEEFLEVKSLQL
jgi:acyl-CoA reductase-like NAD-dependent aldehyde dehydrogenase